MDRTELAPLWPLELHSILIQAACEWEERAARAQSPEYRDQCDVTAGRILRACHELAK